ncbi:MAG: putative ABC transporter permease [Oscillospiraceae bacterium]|nr:putative ABC transporter permease [Oscillospiraceae bacterium]
MSLFLTLAYLFFIGSVFGWVLELFFRRFFSTSNPERKWINPGFCTGPYLPIYGSGLCVLYLLASLGDRWSAGSSAPGRLLLFALMALSMTAIEYFAGLALLKWAKLRLWDYSDCRGNVRGLICPRFSFYWAVLGALYYFLVHPHVLRALDWLAHNLTFSFVIGWFFGVFTLDVAYSAHLAAHLKAFAEENQVVVRYEALKAHIQSAQKAAQRRVHFFFSLRSELPLAEHLKNAKDALEEIRRRI